MKSPVSYLPLNLIMHLLSLNSYHGKIGQVQVMLYDRCKYKSVDIIAGAVCQDHVHLSVAIPPKISISDFMGYLKGKSTLMS